jgi:hypothetical protein
MQTFLPYADFQKTAQSLDYKRLGKQRVEAFQILQAIEKRKNGITKGAWINHPCVIMWMNAEITLMHYAIAICKEWIARGYNDSMLPRFEQMLEQATQQGLPTDAPTWLGDARVHISHQSNLIKKFPEHYGNQFASVPNDIPYYWADQN